MAQAKSKGTLFDKAQKKEAEQPKAKKNTKPEVQINGLSDYAMVDAAIKSLESVKSTLHNEVAGEVAEHFVESGVAAKGRPGNFKGTDDGVTASCELRKRSSRSNLSEEEVSFLEDNGVQYETVQDQEEAYIINPQYTNDQNLLQKISEKLEEIEELPDDFIQMQPAKTRRVISDNSLNQMFQSNDKDTVRKLLQICGTIALKPKIEETDAAEILNQVKDLLEG